MTRPDAAELSPRTPGDPLDVIEQLYDALAGGDAVTLRRLLAPGFRAYLTPGLPWELGRRAVESADTMIRDVWGLMAAEFIMAPAPEHTYVVGDVVIVQGTYRGRSRRTGRPLTAWFTHTWLIIDGHILQLRQVTDTAAWWDAVDRRPQSRSGAS